MNQKIVVLDTVQMCDAYEVNGALFNVALYAGHHFPSKHDTLE